MLDRQQIQEQIRNITCETYNYVNLLYWIPCTHIRNIILNLIRDRLQLINYLTSQSTFTTEQLSKYTGKSGAPAYVAVNGVVYDVTNNAAWAAATHFGLMAGKDLTKEFASCHAGQNILSKLKAVGRLI